MASSFAEAYLRKREKERAAQTHGVNDNGTYVNPETGRVEQVSGAGNSAERFAGIVNPESGRARSTSPYVSNQTLSQYLSNALRAQANADRYSNILMREPESGVLMPDYDAIVAANNSQNSLSLAARSRALAQKALADYEKEYRTQLDSYGPYIDGSGKDVAGQYNARKKAVDDANQAYEDAFADYQKKQQAADYARRQDDKRKALQNEWAQYKQIQADKSKAEADAAEAWKKYYFVLPRAEDFASNQKNAYVSMDGKRVDSADYDSDVDGSAYFRDFLMTDKELAIMTYLRNTLGDEAARRYEDSLRSTETERKEQQSLHYGAEHPVLASAGSVGMNIANEIAAPIGIAKAKLSGQELDPDADYFRAGKMRDAIRAGVMQDMGPVGQFVYQTLMSAVADSGVNGLIGAATGGSSWIGAGLTGASGFSDMVRQIKKRGGDDTQALVLGLIEGAAEVVTEKMGFDRVSDLLTSKAPFKSAIKAVLGNMLSEFGEESATTVINQTADYLYGAITGRETEFTGRIEGYLSDGKTESEALANALLDMGGETLMDGLGGALGGLVMGGGSAAINQGLSAAIAKYADYKSQGNTQTTSQTAQEDAQARQNAQATESKVMPENRAQTAQEAETMARIERLAQETADAEMGEQAARQEMRQTEQQRVRQTPRQAAQTTENASAESVHNAAAVYGRDAASFESHYVGGALQNYRRAFDAVYQAGKVNLSLEQVNQAGGEIVSGLSEQAKAEIWQAGRNAAASVVVPGVSKQYVGKMNHNQRAQIRILDEIGKKYGIQIDVVSSLDYGRTAGNAALVGRNHIVVASDAMNSAYVQAGVHELVHNLRRESSAYYNAFSSVVLDTLKKDGSFDLQVAIAERIRQYAEQGQQLSQEDALEEIVAEAAPAALTNREAMRAFVNENRSLAEKVRDFFVRFADELRQIAAKYGAGNSRAEVDAMLRADTQDLVAIAESLDMALSAAQEDAQAQIDAGVSETESTMAGTQLADGGIEVSGNDIAYPADADTLYSLRTLSKSDYVKERDKAAKQLSDRLGISIEQANKYIDDISGVAAMIAADQSRLDFEAEPAFSALKKNSEYKWTVDFSTLCKKRLLYTGTFDAIQEQMADAILTEEDYIKLRDMMAQKGYEVACAFCYVESRRKNNGEIIDKFLDVYKKAQRDGTKMELGASNRRRAFSTETGFTPTIADFNTTNGILNIMHNHKGVYDAYMYFMNARGTSKPKLIETRTEYNSEILSLFRNKNAVNAMIKRGGLRLQSFSDFEVVNMLDMMQVVYDMSRVGLTSQAYTKVPAFARVFGRTGIKINESLVVKGLDANGQLIFDDVEGMPHEEAFRIREMYPENVGTILVGKDDSTIRAAMADPRIDFIIPYHRSGWSETNMQALGIKGYTDYTKSQNEISQTGKKIKNFYPSEYWDYSKSGDENAQIYLEKCAESGRIPKFPQFAGESGYWKTLIDFKMYDNNGNGAPQRAVTPDVNLTEARRVLDEYKGGHRTLPVAQDVVKDFIEWYRWNRSSNDTASSEVIEMSDADTKFSLKDSDAFKKWFGDSKVVDENGDPQVVYHATDSEFNVFDRSKLGSLTSGNTDWQPAVRSAQIGFWFSDRDLSIDMGMNADQTKSVYLSMQKPYRTKLESLWNALEHTRPDTYVKRLQERGYDGLRVQDSEFGGVSYVVFEPTQIKSATNNSGAFDAENPDIRFSLKDTSELDDQTKALLDGWDVEYNAEVVQAYARSALRAADKDTAKINQQVRQAAGKILKDTASKYDRKTLERNMRAMVEKYAQDGGEGVGQAAAEMAKAIIEQNTHLDTTLRDQYSELRRDLRENGVSLTEIQKAEAASICGSYTDFRNALRGTVKLTGKSMTLEARWGELSMMYPEIFHEDTVEGDQVNALIEFKHMMQPVYINDYGMDMDTAAVDLAMRIQGDALSIAGAKEASKQLYVSAQKIESRVKKAYDAEVKAQKKAKLAQFQEIAKRLDEAKKLGDTQEYDSAMADYRKLIRKTTGMKMLGQEGMSLITKMRFSQLAKSMQSALKVNDTAAYQNAFAEYKALLKKERITRTVVSPAVQDALNQARARFKANQEAKEGTVKKQKATQRVIKQAKALIDMLGNKKKGVRVPRMMQDSLLTLLEGLDINGRGAANKGEVTKQAAAMREQLTALRQTYQAIWDSQSRGEAPAVLDGLMMVINEDQRAQLDDALSILEQGGQFTLRSMTTEQLKALGDALTTVKQTISTIGVLWRKGRYQNVAELADASIQEMGDRPEAKLKGMSVAGTTRDFLMLDMLEPVSYGERLGQAGSEIIQGLYEGERAKFARLREAREATAQMMEESGVTGYDIGKWRKHVNTVRMGGHDVKLTDTQAMDIYLTAQRPQGKQHMLGDGIRIKTSKQTGAQVFTVRMTEADIAKVSDLLSDKQKLLAHKMQGYLAGDVAKWGNDVTQQMYLYDYFTEQTYWPLTSDPNVLKTSEPSADRSLTAITQPGFMKPLTKNANNPVIIMDAVDVFNRHVAEMASYSGLAMPMTDALGYMNYKQRNEEGALTGSVKESMERLLGNGGGKYMVTLLQDLNHARHGDDLTHLSKLTGNYKRSAVSGKIRVVLQQPTSIARAAQEISPVYLAQGLKLGNKADIAEMQKYSALAWWKGNASGMDIGVGRSADQILWGDTSKLDTARTKVETAGGLIDAGKADDVTWAAMWRAVKRETQRIHPELQVGSEAYFKAVAERFDKIIDKTQVVDSIMHRSQIMRSQNGLIKELTAFQAEPIKSYNMLARSAMELGRNPKSNAAQTAMVRATLVFAANAALTALAEAAFDVFKHRDDDDTLMEYLLNAKKGFLKEYTDEFLGSWLDNMNVIAMIPGFSQAYEILTGGSAPEMMSFEGMSDAVQAAKTFVDHFVGDNKKKTTTYGAIAPVLKAASQITGLPISGIMANTEMLAKIADPQWLNYKAVSGKFADIYEALYAAILEDNERAITRIRGRLSADTQGNSAKNPAQIDQGVANVLAEKDERIAQAYQLREEGKSTQLVALKKQIMEDGFTDAMVTAAINRYESQAKAQEKTTQEKDMNAQLTAKLFSYNNLYAAIRNGSIEDVGIIAEYLQANSTAKDPAASIRSQVSGEFKQEYLDAVMNGGSAESLKKKLMSLGLTEDDLNGWVKDARYAELKESVGEGDIADAKQVAMELIASGADVSNVVTSLNSKYRPLYIELINSGRTYEAEKLQKDLESLGLIKQKTGQNYYRKDYMDKWVTDYNNKNK